jgi:hypothetical protein
LLDTGSPTEDFLLFPLRLEDDEEELAVVVVVSVVVSVVVVGFDSIIPLAEAVLFDLTRERFPLCFPLLAVEEVDTTKSDFIDNEDDTDPALDLSAFSAFVV